VMEARAGTGRRTLWLVSACSGAMSREHREFDGLREGAVEHGADQLTLRNLSERLPGKLQTNNRAEMYVSRRNVRSSHIGRLLILGTSYRPSLVSWRQILHHTFLSPFAPTLNTPSPVGSIAHFPKLLRR